METTAIRPKRRHFLLNRVFLCGCALALAAGCVAQQTGTPSLAAKATELSPAQAAILNRKIEVMIRSELSVPPQYQVTIGARQKSDMAGFDTIPVTFSLPGQTGRTQTV